MQQQPKQPCAVVCRTASRVLHRPDHSLAAQETRARAYAETAGLDVCNVFHLAMGSKKWSVIRSSEALASMHERGIKILVVDTVVRLGRASEELDLVHDWIARPGHEVHIVRDRLVMRSAADLFSHLMKQTIDHLYVQAGGDRG